MRPAKRRTAGLSLGESSSRSRGRNSPRGLVIRYLPRSCFEGGDQDASCCLLLAEPSVFGNVAQQRDLVLVQPKVDPAGWFCFRVESSPGRPGGPARLAECSLNERRDAAGVSDSRRRGLIGQLEPRSSSHRRSPRLVVRSRLWLCCFRTRSLPCLRRSRPGKLCAPGSLPGRVRSRPALRAARVPHAPR